MLSFDTPGHVPQHLVKPYNWFGEPDFDPDDVWQSRVAWFADAPRIFWNPIVTTVMLPGGSWVVTKADDIRHVLLNDADFSSEGLQSNAIGRVGAFDRIPVLPLEMSRPDHTKFRLILNNQFSAKMINDWSDRIRAMAVELIEKMKPRGEGEFVTEFSRPYPVLTFLAMMGMPVEKADEFLSWEYAFLHNPDPAVRAKAGDDIINYFVALIAEKRRCPGDDIYSNIVHARIDDRPLTDIEILGLSFNLFTGGLDTVTTTSEWIFRHIAEDQVLQARLRNNPKEIPVVLEELLRLYPVIMTARTATRDLEFAGVEIKAGDMVSLPLMLGNYDPGQFPNPSKLDSSRERVSQHLAFGFGAHSCVGKHLARRELQIAIEEWVSRLPGFRISPDAALKAHPGVVGLNALRLVWRS